MRDALWLSGRCEVTAGTNPSRPTLSVIEGGGGRRRTIWCDRLPGFGLRTYASGRSSYIAQAHMSGRTRVVTIGRVSVMSERQARSLARLVLLQAYAGQSPADERQRVRAAPAFPDFMKEYWQRIEPRWKPSTANRNQYYRRCHLDGAFAGQFIDAIGAPDVQRWFVGVSDNAGPGAANRTLAILSAMFARAEAWGYRPEGSNPCRGIRRNRPRRFGRALEPAEIARLGAVLDATASEQPLAAAAVRLLLVTGCRVSELLSLEWSDVRGARLQLRDAKAGPRTVWLGDEARSVLAGLPRAKEQQIVFLNAATGKATTIPKRYWSKLQRMATLPPTRLHDLRHSFASHAARGNETMPAIGRMLGHRRPASTARYTHMDDARLIEAAELVGGAILNFMG